MNSYNIITILKYIFPLIEHIPPLQSTSANGDTEYFITDYEKATCLNDFFVSISSVYDSNSSLPHFDFKTNSRLTDVLITESEIVDILKILNINKALGDDGISHKILKSNSY